jgi:hypothetical protein
MAKTKNNGSKGLLQLSPCPEFWQDVLNTTAAGKKFSISQ